MPDLDLTESPFYVWIPCIPPVRSGQRVKVVHFGGHSSIRQAKGYLNARESLAGMLLAAKPATWPTITWPVFLWLDIVLPHLASTPKRNRDQYWPVSTTPDADNCMKFYGDAMQMAGYVQDDKLLHPWIRRWHGPTPGIRLKASLAVALRSLPDDELANVRKDYL